MKILTLYSRRECHLCEQLLEALTPLVSGRAQIRIVDVDQDPELVRRYGLRVPVLAADEEELSEYPLDADKVRRYLGEA